MRHRAIALSGLLSLAVAACGGSAASLSASPAPSAAAVAGPAASSSVPHGAPELETNLPRAFRGQPLFLLSFGPTELAASSAGESFADIITQAGGDVGKAGFAVANDSGPSRDATFNAFAVSGGGADGSKLVKAYTASAIAGGASLSSAPAKLGGKSVTRIKSLDTNPLGDAWVYAVDGVMYGVQAKDEALATELIGLLP